VRDEKHRQIGYEHWERGESLAGEDRRRQTNLAVEWDLKSTVCSWLLNDGNWIKARLDTDPADSNIRLGSNRATICILAQMGCFRIGVHSRTKTFVGSRTRLIANNEAVLGPTRSKTILVLPDQATSTKQVDVAVDRENNKTRPIPPSTCLIKDGHPSPSFPSKVRFTLSPT
jgi:hypothetical protein